MLGQRGGDAQGQARVLVGAVGVAQVLATTNSFQAARPYDAPKAAVTQMEAAVVEVPSLSLYDQCVFKAERVWR